MAVNVSNKFRETVYSGEKLYTCFLYINGNRISPRQIGSITISRPIIDTNEKTFYIGTFISDKIEVIFKNTNNLNINSGDEAHLLISLKVDGDDEQVDCGTFIIDELNEDYYKKNKITCYDYAIKFASAVNTKIEDVFDYDATTQTYSIAAEDLLIWLCNHYGVTLGTYPNTNKDAITGNWDSTLSGKRYISWIAEIMGGNAKIGRDNVLNIQPLKRQPVCTINAKRSKSLTLGEKYKVSGVTYFDAIRNYTSGTDTNNVLIIRQDNIFVSSQTQITNIYNDVQNFEIYSLKNENFGDISLDAYDIVTYQVDETSYNTFYNNEITYATSIMVKVDTQIPNKQQEITTNVQKVDTETSIRMVKADVDSINGTVTILSGRVTDTESDISTLKITDKSIEENVSSINAVVNGKYIYTLTNDTEYLSNKDYYKIEDEKYVLMVEGTDYNIGDTIPSNTVYEQSFVSGLTQNLSDLSSDYDELFDKFEDYAPLTSLEEISTSVNTLKTSTYTKTQVQQIANGTGYFLTNDTKYQGATTYYEKQNDVYVKLINGVDYVVGDDIPANTIYEYGIISAVVNSSGTFDIEGMHYQKSGAPTASTINEKGLEVDKTSDNSELLFAGYDENSGQAIVRTENLTARVYLRCGGNGRFESYTNDNGNTGVGFFLEG